MTIDRAENPPMRGADWHRQIGPYRFERSSFRPHHRWGCVNTEKGRGVDFQTNPLSAFVHLLRWQNKPVEPM